MSSLPHRIIAFRNIDFSSKNAVKRQWNCHFWEHSLWIQTNLGFESQFMPVTCCMNFAILFLTSLSLSLIIYKMGDRSSMFSVGQEIPKVQPFLRNLAIYLPVLCQNLNMLNIRMEGVQKMKKEIAQIFKTRKGTIEFFCCIEWRIWRGIRKKVNIL